MRVKQYLAMASVRSARQQNNQNHATIVRRKEEKKKCDNDRASETDIISTSSDFDVQRRDVQISMYQEEIISIFLIMGIQQYF